jgi:O-6-methylguanine DNA methyltransferase
MRIDYTIVDSPLGLLLIAAAGRGICAVYMGETWEQLETALKEEYPTVEMHLDSTRLGAWTEALLDYLGGRQTNLNLPLDVPATAFRQRVWQALQAIPYGHTRTYSEIACALGNPKAARAVGSACAANPVSLLIPCHRALREDGGLGGYRWGLERKQRLLDLERPPPSSE